MHIVSTTEPKLHNILTQEIANEAIRKDLIGIKEKGQKLYVEYRRERYIEKNTRLSQPIHRNSLKTFKFLQSGSNNLANTKKTECEKGTSRTTENSGYCTLTSV